MYSSSPIYTAPVCSYLTAVKAVRTHHSITQEPLLLFRICAAVTPPLTVEVPWKGNPADSGKSKDQSKSYPRLPGQSHYYHHSHPLRIAMLRKERSENGETLNASRKRSTIAAPSLLKRAKHARGEKKKECVGCHTAMSASSHYPH